MRKVLLVVFVFLVVSDAQADMGKESLRDLSKFFVLIEGFPSGAVEVEGITSTTLQIDVEVELRKAGISIFDAKKAPIMAPYLYLGYNHFGRGFHVCLALYQTVSLISRPTFVTSAATWDKGKTGSATSRDAAFIRQAVKDLTDMFINDYLSVNPKK